MASCSMDSLCDTKSFCFQFSSVLLTLVLLTQFTCTIGCITHFLGTSIVLIVTTWTITKLFRKKYFHETLSSHKKAVLVTGCDSGFGNRLANRLNTQGYTVYATCMDPNGTGPQQLLKSAAFPKTIKLVAMDVTSDADVQRVYEEVSSSIEKDGNKLWAIVNNAGIFSYARVEWGKLDYYQKVLDVNVIGLARVTRVFLPLIRKSKGRIVNVASIAGRISAPGLAVYSMSKHAVVAFSNSLRREMIPFGVKVSTIEPSTYKTPMADVKLLYEGAKKIWTETPESIRNEYGEEYFESSLGLIDGKDGRDNPEEVVDALYDAIAAVEPEIRYKVCSLGYGIILLMSDYLPFSINDMIYMKRNHTVKPKGA